MPWLRPAQYLALDVSVDFVAQALSSLQRDFPAVTMTAIAADIAQPLPLPGGDVDGDAGRLFFYPGSSIGNFAPHDARALTARMRAACRGHGGLLIGVVESLGGLLLGESLGQVGIFLIFILVLLLRPQGLFGARA